MMNEFWFNFCFGLIVILFTVLITLYYHKQKVYVVVTKKRSQLSSLEIFGDKEDAIKKINFIIREYYYEYSDDGLGNDLYAVLHSEEDDFRLYAYEETIN